jgi:hypothetical protein
MTLYFLTKKIIYIYIYIYIYIERERERDYLQGYYYISINN